MTCRFCSEPLPYDARSDARFCSAACRQAAYRTRLRAGDDAVLGAELRSRAQDDPRFAELLRELDRQ